jgi:hypothetical protein
MIHGFTNTVFQKLDLFLSVSYSVRPIKKSKETWFGLYRIKYHPQFQLTLQKLTSEVFVSDWVELDKYKKHGHKTLQRKYEIKCCSGVDMYKESKNMELPH